MQPPTFSLLVYYSVLKIGKNSFVLLQRNSYFRRFTPDQLGIHASWIIIWNIIENCCLCLIVFFLNVELKLRILDLIAYCGYKYVGVTAVLISFLVTRSIWIYRYAMIYSSLTISYFLVRFFPCVIHRFDSFSIDEMSAITNTSRDGWSWSIAFQWTSTTSWSSSCNRHPTTDIYVVLHSTFNSCLNKKNEEEKFDFIPTMSDFLWQTNSYKCLFGFLSKIRQEKSVCLSIHLRWELAVVPMLLNIHVVNDIVQVLRRCDFYQCRKIEQIVGNISRFSVVPTKLNNHQYNNRMPLNVDKLIRLYFLLRCEHEEITEETNMMRTNTL